MVRGAPILFSLLSVGCGSVAADLSKAGVSDTAEDVDPGDSGEVIDDPEPGGEEGGGEEGGGEEGGGEEGGEPVDADGDGYTTEDGDCDDSDEDVSPDGDEGDRADGVDDDCSGTADDRTVCADGLADYDGIQAAIDDAPEGFVLLVCPGVYDEELTITGGDITLRAIEGPEVTIIRGDGEGSVITIAGRIEVGVEGFTITGGVADAGGGVLVTRSEVNLLDNWILDNVAVTRGGGVALEQASGLVSGNVVSGNSSDTAGGLSAWGGSVESEDNTFDDNAATTIDETLWSEGGGGGGVVVYGDHPVRDNMFRGNTSAYNGGGLYLLYSTGDAADNVFIENAAGEDGGGLYANQATAEVSGNTFRSNAATDDAGGMRVYRGRLTVTDNEFYGNVAGDDGGGLKLSHATHTIQRNTFEDNVAGDAGGGLELDNDTSDASDLIFVGNRAARGGGLHSWRAEGAVTLSDLTFEGNEASGCGGAIQLDNDPFTITFQGLDVRDNTALDGAGLCMEMAWLDDEETNFDTSRVVVKNALFAGNQAGDDATIYAKHGVMRLTNVTVADNEGAEVSGLSAKEASTVTVTNGIFSHNDAPYLLVVEDDGALTVEYTALYDDTAGFSGLDDPRGADGNIDDDPSYADRRAGDYSLDSDSPCIDAGDPSISDTDRSRSDMGYTGGPGGA